MLLTTRPWRLCSARFLGQKALKRQASTSPSAAPAPPLLLKLRGDLKTAMQNKDKDRLNVLRGLIADVTNSSKNNNPITTDMHVLALLRKRATAGKQAAQEFAQGGRQDLRNAEESQVNILEEYAGGVDVVSDEEIRARIGEVINSGSVSQEGGEKLNKGTIMKKLLGPGGVFDGKPVEKHSVAKMVDAALGNS